MDGGIGNRKQSDLERERERERIDQYELEQKHRKMQTLNAHEWELGEVFKVSKKIVITILFIF